MDKIIEFPDRDIIEDEALEWLIRLDADHPLDKGEECMLDEWLARSPVHRDALKSLNTFWSSANVLSSLAEPSSVVGLLKKRCIAYFQPLMHRRRSATFATLLVLGLMVLGLDGFNLKNNADTNGLYVTAVGQQKTVTLADDSVIQLNTNSQVQVDYRQGFRNIRLLQGEAHFDVAKDKSKPFRVYAGSGRVQAVGTAFNVYLKGSDIDVFVTEGRVAVASILNVDNPLPADAHTAHSQANTNIADDTDAYIATRVNGLGEISAGQGALLKIAGKSVIHDVDGGIQDVQRFELERLPDIASSTNDDNNYHQLAWRKGLIIFTGESLEQVIAEISRYTPVQIDILNPELRNIEIGGQVEVGDTDSMFKALEINFGLTIKRISYNHVQVIAINP
jgi:transmembrane sensor